VLGRLSRKKSPGTWEARRGTKGGAGSRRRWIRLDQLRPPRRAGMKILALRGKHYRVPPLERKAAPFQFLVMNQAPTKESDLCPFGTQVDCVPLPFTSDAIFYCRVCGNTWPQFRTPGRQTWTPRNPNDKLRAMSYAGMRIMKIAEDVPPACWRSLPDRPPSGAPEANERLRRALCALLRCLPDVLARSG
jgi:hypothetical protein